MKALALIFCCIACLWIGYFWGQFAEQHKSNPANRTPENIVKDVARLYNSEIHLPDCVLIGIPGESSSEAFLFTFQDGVKGLEYVGVFTLKK